MSWRAPNPRPIKRQAIERSSSEVAPILMDYFWGPTPANRLAPGLGQGYDRRRRYKKSWKKGAKGKPKKDLFRCHDLQGEKNYFDLLISGGDMDSTPVIHQLNIIPAGSLVEQRLGRRVQMASVYIRFTVIPPAVSSSNFTSNNRIMLVYDKQTNGAAYAGTDLLEVATVHGQLNMENRQRFEVLMDKVVTLHTTAGVGNGTTNFWALDGLFWKKFKNLHRRETIYGSTVPSIADIATGSLSLFIVGDKAAGVLAPTYNFESRLRYYS